MLPKRNSFVDEVRINDVVIGSHFQIGDSSLINSHSKVFALHREKEIFFGFESDYEDFIVFTEPIPIPPISEKLHFKKFNANPTIHVSFVRIIGLSTSSIFQIGNTKKAYLESRIHHTRQLEEHKENITDRNV